MHPYKQTPTQELSEDNFNRRMYFCEQMMRKSNNNIIQLENIWFSDESTFILHGHVSRQNYRYWINKNPH